MLKEIEKANKKQDLLNTYYDKEENIKNKEFNQFTLEGQRLLIQLSLENATARAVFDILALKMNKNNTIIIKEKQIADAIHKDERTIRRAISFLKQNNYLQIIKYQTINVYFINPFICYCCAAGTKKKLMSVYTKNWLKEHSVDDESYNVKTSIFDVKKLHDTDEIVNYRMNFYKEHKELKLPEFAELYRNFEIELNATYMSEYDAETLISIIDDIRYKKTNKSLRDVKEFLEKQDDEEKQQIEEITKKQDDEEKQQMKNQTTISDEDIFWQALDFVSEEPF